MCKEVFGKDLIVWERWVPMRNSVANHMQVQLLPVDSKGFINYDYVVQQVARNNPSFTFNKLASAVYG